jgi:hypothetical protein
MSPHSVWPIAAAGLRLRGYARVGEALLLLLGLSAAQQWLPLGTWAPLLGRPTPVPESWQGLPLAESLPRIWGHGREVRVCSALERAQARLPWRPSCLARAAAVQIMLRRRQSGGVVVIGLRPQPQGAPLVHAWLLGRSGCLVGGREAQGFTPTTLFEVPQGPRIRRSTAVTSSVSRDATLR